MEINRQEIYTRKQEQKISKGIAGILNKQKKEFVQILTREKKSYEVKSVYDDVMSFLNNIKEQIPLYLTTELPKIMQKAYKQAYKNFGSYMGNYAPELIFNVDSEPASQYIKQLKDLHLSKRQGSIYATTEKEILTILEQGILSGQSYTSIGEEIQKLDPFVFSKSRAELIAIQEVGQAYGWADFQPGRLLVEDGYQVVKKWRTSRDDKVRESHKENEIAGWIDFNKTFPGTGDMYAPSRQFRCRCTAIQKIIG